MSRPTDEDYLKYKGRYPKSSRIFTAMMIDLVAVNFMAYLVLKLYGAIFSQILSKYALGYIGVAVYLACLLYVPISSSLGRTLGQIVVGLKIQRVDGSRLGLGPAIARWVFSVFSPFGYNTKKVPWFDRRYGAVLISTKESSQ